jgi:hypothetical protein
MGDEPEKKAPKGRGGPRNTRKKVGVNASTTGGPGPRVINDLVPWRRAIREGRTKLDDIAKNTFLEHFSQNGMMMAGATAAGVTYSAVKNHLDNDPEFMEAFLEAKQAYRDLIMSHAKRLILEGVEEPIIGGQFKDQVVATKIVYPTNLIAMEMRRVEPEYKERSEVDIKGGGGVLVVPAGQTPQEWIEEQRRLNEQREPPGREGLPDAPR